MMSFIALEKLKKGEMYVFIEEFIYLKKRVYLFECSVGRGVLKE